MSDAIKGLFGGGKDEDNDQDDKIKKIGLDPGHAKSFVNRYLDGDPSEGYDKDEAAESFQKVARNASPEQMERATRQALENMNPGQRSDFAKMLEQRQARGGGNVPIQQAGDRSAGGGASGGDMGIDDILGGLLGGASGGGGGGGGGLGDLFGSLLGGGGQSQGGLGGVLGGVLGDDDDSSRSQTGAQSGGGGGMLGGLGDLLGSPAGKALIGGIAAYGMKEIMDGKK